MTEAQVYFEPRQPVIYDVSESDQRSHPPHTGCPTLKQLSIFLKVVQDELTLYDVLRVSYEPLSSHKLLLTLHEGKLLVPGVSYT